MTLCVCLAFHGITSNHLVEKTLHVLSYLIQSTVPLVSFSIPNCVTENEAQGTEMTCQMSHTIILHCLSTTLLFIQSSCWWTLGHFKNNIPQPVGLFTWWWSFLLQKPSLALYEDCFSEEVAKIQKEYQGGVKPRDLHSFQGLNSQLLHWQEIFITWTTRSPLTLPVKITLRIN